MLAIFIFTLFLSAILLISWAKFGKKSITGGQGKNKNESLAQNQAVKINKEFEFPGLDETGRAKGKIGLKVTEIEKTNQVVVQEKTYTAQADKVFLIVNLELKNEDSKGLNIYPGDLTRLIVDDNDEKMFAPDLHNNYVLVAPISTKTDRVGFIVNKDFKSLSLQIGEVEKDKEFIEIKFPT